MGAPSIGQTKKVVEHQLPPGVNHERVLKNLTLMGCLFMVTSIALHRLDGHQQNHPYEGGGSHEIRPL